AAACACFRRFAESIRLLFAPRAGSVCDRTHQRGFAVAHRFRPGREAKGVDLQPAESLSVFPVCALDLSRGGCYYRWLIANLPRVFKVSRQAVLCSGRKRYQSLALPAVVAR